MVSALEYQREALSKGKIKPVNLIHGDEEFLVRSLRERLEKLYGEGFKLLWGDEIDLEELKRSLSDSALFSQTSEEVIFVQDFESLLKRLGRSKKGVESLVRLIKRVKRKKLFFVVGKKLKAQELSKEPFRTIASLGDVVVAGKLPKDKVANMVKRKMEREGGGIEPEALELLVDMCDGDLTALKHEVEKLLVYLRGKRATVEVVRRVCTRWGEGGLSQFTDRFFSGDLEGSLRSLEEVLSGGTHALQVLSAISSYAIKLYGIHALLEEGLTEEEAMKAVGVSHPFLRLKLKEHLPKNPKWKVLKLLRELHRTDLEVKTSYKDLGKALRTLITGYLLSL